MTQGTGIRQQGSGSRQQARVVPCSLFPVASSAGFTFIELLVYLGLVSVALTITTTLAIALLQAEARGSVRETVDTSASRVIAQIAETTRAATVINTADSIFGNPLGRLSLTTRDAARSPTVFSVTNGRLEVSEGIGSAVALTTGRVDVVGFRLTRLNPAGAKEGVQIELTVRFRNPSNDPQFEFSQTYATGFVLH
ncbi:MAG: hypothetical protein Q8R32_02985 [bacterium]|nr:hypothetical protein [bacterium]